MTEPAELTAEERIAQIQERRAKKREALEAIEAEQYAKDLEAIEALENEHGRIGTVRVVHKPGLPTRAGVRLPTGAEYKRFAEQVHRAIDKKNTPEQRKAQDLLARSCWVYPADKDVQDLMLEASPGLLSNISLVAARLSEGAAEEEGKG